VFPDTGVEATLIGWWKGRGLGEVEVHYVSPKCDLSGKVNIVSNALRIMRPLIATVAAGGGRRVVSAALDETWRVWRPNDVLDQADIGKCFSPPLRRILSKGYVKLVNHAPEPCGKMFAKTDRPKMARTLNCVRAIFPSSSCVKRGCYAKEFKADVVLCTHLSHVGEPSDDMGQRSGNCSLPLNLVNL